MAGLDLIMNFGIMSDYSSKIFFYSSKARALIRNKARLSKFLELIFKKEKTDLSTLNIVFCSDKELLEINKQYLDHDYYTDIITFNLAEKNKPVFGEIYISVDRVKENAKSHKVLYSTELYRVIIHGVLHLCGFKDKSASNQVVMRQNEDKYLTQFLSP